MVSPEPSARRVSPDSYRWMNHFAALESPQVHQIGFSQLVVFGLVALLLFGGKSVHEMAQSVAEALSNFRGGPGSPSHPLPADDSKLLNRKADHADDKSEPFR
jgi:Sec-independent protein translocase protein TatA